VTKEKKGRLRSSKRGMGESGSGGQDVSKRLIVRIGGKYAGALTNKKGGGGKKDGRREGS